MSSDPETTRIVRSWLDEGVTQLPDRLLDAVLDQVPATRQSRGWPVLDRHLPVLAAAVLLVAVIAGAVTVGYRLGDASLRATPAPSTMLPSTRSLASAPPGPIAAGGYVVDAFDPIRITFELPVGWSNAGGGSDLLIVERHPDGAAQRPPRGVQLGFSAVENLFADPCGLDQLMLDPPVGPRGDKLAEAFRGITSYQASAARRVTIGGHQALRLELELGLYMCSPSEAGLWRTPAGLTRVAADESERLTLWILDVDGERILITASSFTDTSQADLDALEAVIETLDVSTSEN